MSLGVNGEQRRGVGHAGCLDVKEGVGRGTKGAAEQTPLLPVVAGGGDSGEMYNGCQIENFVERKMAGVNDHESGCWKHGVAFRMAER